MGRSGHSIAIMAALSLLSTAIGPVAATAATDTTTSQEGEYTPWPSATLKGAEAVTADHGRFVVVGSGGDGDRRSFAKAWVSDDGLMWERSPDAPTGKGMRMLAVTGVDRGYVALGTQVAPEGVDEGDRLVAWFSDYGLEWQPATVERPGPEFWGASHVELVSGPAGPLVLADDTEHFRLWRSSGRRSWQVSGTPDVDRAISIAATPEVYLLSGFDSGEGLSIEDSLRLFSSADGETWQELDDAPPIMSVTASSNGTVVGTGLPELWATTDLETWERVWEAPDAIGADDAGRARWIDARGYGDAITWTGDRFATTGWILSTSCLEDRNLCPAPVHLFSPDGFTWLELTGPDGAPGPDRKAWSMRAAASLLGHTVVLGQSERKGSVKTLAWLMNEPPPAPGRSPSR